MSKIFISYRRDDSAGYARSIYKSFEQRWGRERVFMDIDSIAPGDDFEEVIERFLEDCSLVVVLIGKNWVRLTDRSGRVRSINDEDDFPHMEVAAALKRRIRVIPLLVGGAPVPEAADLPEDLRGLRRRNAVDLRDRSFDRDLEELLGVVDRLINDPGATSAQQPVTTHRSVVPGDRTEPIGKTEQQTEAAAGPKAQEAAADQKATEDAALKAKELAERQAAAEEANEQKLREQAAARRAEAGAVERERVELAARAAREAEREEHDKATAQGTTPAMEERPDRGTLARDSVPGMPLPWRKIVGVVLAVAGITGLFMYQQSAKEKERRVVVEAETQREKITQLKQPERITQFRQPETITQFNQAADALSRYELLGSRWRISYTDSETGNPRGFDVIFRDDAKLSVINTLSGREMSQGRWEVIASEIRLILSAGATTYTGSITDRNHMSGRATTVVPPEWQWQAQRIEN